jgi:hypothetical protein
MGTEAFFRVKRLAVCGLVIGCCFPTVNVVGVENSIPLTPYEVVRTYVNADVDGAWFSEEGRRELQKYTTDTIYVATIIAPTIITAYKVRDARVANESATVDVEYEVIGYSEDLGSFEARMETKKQVVELRRIEGYWKITTQIFPHMKWQTVVEQMRKSKRRSLEYLKKIQDPNDRERYTKQITYENERRDNLIRKIESAARKANAR